MSHHPVHTGLQEHSVGGSYPFQPVAYQIDPDNLIWVVQNVANGLVASYKSGFRNKPIENREWLRVGDATAFIERHLHNMHGLDQMGDAILWYPRDNEGLLTKQAREGNEDRKLEAFKQQLRAGYGGKIEVSPADRVENVNRWPGDPVYDTQPAPDGRWNWYGEDRDEATTIPTSVVREASFEVRQPDPVPVLTVEEEEFVEWLLGQHVIGTGENRTMSDTIWAKLGAARRTRGRAKLAKLGLGRWFDIGEVPLKNTR